MAGFALIFDDTHDGGTWYLAPNLADVSLWDAGIDSMHLRVYCGLTTNDARLYVDNRTPPPILFSPEHQHVLAALRNAIHSVPTV